MLTTNPFDDDKLREECGIFGIWGAPGASSFVALGLHALQHRGQEAAGITSFDGDNFHSHRAMGHVAGNFDRDDIIRNLAGSVAIGHVRYSTTGETAIRNVQPLFAELSSGGFAVSHNGNISNAMKVRRDTPLQRGTPDSRFEFMAGGPSADRHEVVVIQQHVDQVLAGTLIGVARQAGLLDSQAGIHRLTALDVHPLLEKAANLTITPERERLVDFSSPVRENVTEVVVTGPSGPKVSQATTSKPLPGAAWRSSSSLPLTP